MIRSMVFSSLETNRVDEPSVETAEPERAGPQARCSLRSALLHCPLFSGMSPPLPRCHCSPALLISSRGPPCYPPPRAFRGTDWSPTKLQPPDHISHFGAKSPVPLGSSPPSLSTLVRSFSVPLGTFYEKKKRKENYVSVYLAVPGLSCGMRKKNFFHCGMWDLTP